MTRIKSAEHTGVGAVGRNSRHPVDSERGYETPTKPPPLVWFPDTYDFA